MVDLIAEMYEIFSINMLYLGVLGEYSFDIWTPRLINMKPFLKLSIANLLTMMSMYID